jgi:hypothetical protein
MAGANTPLKVSDGSVQKPSIPGKDRCNETGAVPHLHGRRQKGDLAEDERPGSVRAVRLAGVGRDPGLPGVHEVRRALARAA